MKKTLLLSAISIILFVPQSCKRESIKEVDVIVFGASSAGVIAAYTAKMKGKSVLILEPGHHLGGLSSGGLGQTDIGNKYAITGLSRDFYQRIGAHYGKMEQWTFEPHVAKSIFQEYVDKAGLKVEYGRQLESTSLTEKTITSIQVKDIDTGTIENYRAKVFIDCTYEGDLMAQAGVSYTVGRESNDTYGENWNGVQLMDKHQFMDGIDPYMEKGNPESGLLWGISDTELAPKGSGDELVQAYNFRLCLTDSVENQIPITKPAGYDASEFELLLRYIEKKQPKELNWALMHIQPMPGRKTDINNSGPFSTDYIGANHNYPDATYEEREAIFKEHKRYTESFLYFLGNDPRVPEHLRNEMKSWGYPKDEYVDSNNFTPQLYVREARRMVSDYVMTEKHCVGEIVAEDGIGMAAYTMDSHNTQRLVVGGMVKNEGDVQEGLGGLPPYPISYRSIVPKQAECTNLLVPVCHSASHIAFGSIRMEPVFMVLGQSAGLAASMAIDHGNNVHKVPVTGLQNNLKTDPTSDGRKGIITLDNDDENIRVAGKWSNVSNFRGKYGKSLLISESPDATATFNSSGLQNTEYNLYVYSPSSEATSDHLNIEVRQDEDVKMLTTEVNTQVSDWVLVTSVDGNLNKNISVKIKASSKTEPIIADAFMLVPTKK